MSHSMPPTNLIADFAPATEPQIGFVKSLVAYKDLGEHAEWMAEKVKLADEGKMSKSFASKLIGRLCALPNKPLDATGVKKDIVKVYAEQTLWAVPAGRYALANDNANALEFTDTNPILFYRVKLGKEGTRWEGRRFVTRIVGGDHSYDIKGAQATEVLRLIHGDILSAAALYGKEFKHCSRCNKELTRRLSRELGIGPHCAAHLGMDPSTVEAAKAKIIEQGHDPQETV